jgi:serine/threonine protein kinase
VKPYLKPNEELMTGFSVKVETKGRVGSSHPNSVSQIIDVLQVLHELHSNGYVHGDIRIENIIYSSNGSFYDFARLKNEIYENYNSDIPGSTMYAVNGKPMIPYHDCCSVHYCIRQQDKQSSSISKMYVRAKLEINN